MRFASLLAGCSLLGVPLTAQGHVWTVDDGPRKYGSVWLGDLNPDGTLDSLSVAPTPDPVSDFDGFGSCVTPVGDIDYNGVPDLAVGAPGDDRAALEAGAVWLLFRDAGGGVTKRIPIRPFVSFGGRDLVSALPTFGGSKGFGTAVTSLGDLDGDGRLELVVGETGNQTASPPETGKVWLLSLASDGSGSVASSRTLQISAVQGERLGSSLATLGDIDGDGVTDFAVGALGSVRLVRMRTTLQPRLVTKITSGQSGFPSGLLTSDDLFGASIAALGDLNGDGVGDLAVGAPGDVRPGSDGGAVWILFMQPGGTVLAHQKINEVEGGLGSHAHTSFGEGLAALGDLNGDTIPDLAVGASGGTGAVFVLFLNADGTVQSSRILTSEFTGLASGDGLGSALANLGDWDGDGRPDLAVGAYLRDGPPTTPDFARLDHAIAAAASGDTILARGGFYPNTLTVDGKSLTIQAWNPGNVKLYSLTVRNLNSSQQVRLSGLRVGHFELFVVGRMSLEANQGRVWIDDCNIGGVPGFGTDSPGIRVSDCASVVLNRTKTNGGVDRPSGTPGLEISGGSKVHAYDSSFLGGLGYSGPPYYYWTVEPGGPGIRVSSPDDFLFLSNCHAEGMGTSSGAHGSCALVVPGIETVGTVHALDSTFQRRGCPGNSISGTVGIVPGQALSLAINNPTRENEQTQFAVEGPVGALVVLRYALTSATRFRLSHRGTDLLGSDATSRVIGVIGSSRTLHWSENLGFLPPGFSILRFYAQAAIVPPRSSLPPSAKPSALPSPLPLYPGSAVGLSRLSGSL